MSKSFFNYPQIAETADYDNVREAIIEFNRDNEDIISIYEYGSVSAPGVSDLDLIFVLKDQISSSEDKFELSSISSFAQGLVADGTVIKMPLKVFENIQYFDNLNFHILSGFDVSVNLPSEQDDKFIKLASIIDWVPERLLKLTRIVNSNEVNITNALCVLHSYGYSLKYLNEILEYSKDSESLIIEIANLRTNWHTVDNPEAKLIKCIKTALNIGIKRLVDYENYLREGNQYLCADFSIEYSIDLELYKNHYLRFSDIHSSQFDLNISSRREGENFLLEISSYYYPHFALLADFDGSLSKRMQNKISPYFQVQEGLVHLPYKNNIHRKMGLAEQNAVFLRRNNLKTGLIRYGFHF